MRIIAYCDASYANLPDGGSQGGYMIFLTDNDNNGSPLAWRSQKLRRMCRSMLTSKTLDVCIWMKHIKEEIDNRELLTAITRTDNKDLVDSVESTKAVDEGDCRNWCNQGKH